MNRYQQVLKHLKILPIILIAFGIVIILANITPRGLPLRDVDKTFDGIKPRTKGSLAEALSESFRVGKAGLEKVASWIAGGSEAGIGPTYHFSNGVDIYEFVLEPHEWSTWIALPADTHSYLIDAENKNYKLCVWDRKCSDRKTDKHYITDLTVDNAIFKILNQEDKPVAITVRIDRN